MFATDLDSGSNGLVEYSILSGNQGNVFQMDPLSGVLTASVILDYEYTSAYRFAPSSDLFDQLFCLVALGMTSCLVCLGIRCVFPLLQLTIVLDTLRES